MTTDRYIEKVKRNLNETGLVIEYAFEKTKINSTLKLHWIYSEKAERHTEEVKDETKKQRTVHLKKYWWARKA